MGKCAKCGNETSHLYDYYAGDVVSSHSDTWRDNNMVKTKTTTMYANVQKRQHFFALNALINSVLYARHYC